MGLVNGFMGGFAMAVAFGKEGDVVIVPRILIGNTAKHQQHKGQGAGSVPSHQAMKGHGIVGGIGKKQKDILQSLLHLGKEVVVIGRSAVILIVEIAHTLPSQLPFKSHSPHRRLCLPKIPHKKIIGIVLSQLLGFENKIVIHGIKGIAICCGIHAVENIVINAYGFIVNLFFRMPARAAYINGIEWNRTGFLILYGSMECVVVYGKKPGMIYKIDKTGAMPGTDVFFNRVRAAFKHIFINRDILCPILSTVKQVHIAMIADSSAPIAVEKIMKYTDVSIGCHIIQSEISLVCCRIQLDQLRTIASCSQQASADFHIHGRVDFDTVPPTGGIDDCKIAKGYVLGMTEVNGSTLQVSSKYAAIKNNTFKANIFTAVIPRNTKIICIIVSVVVDQNVRNSIIGHKNSTLFAKQFHVRENV